MRGSLKFPLISVSFSTAAKTTEKKKGPTPGYSQAFIPAVPLTRI